LGGLFLYLNNGRDNLQLLSVEDHLVFGTVGRAARIKVLRSYSNCETS